MDPDDVAETAEAARVQVIPSMFSFRKPVVFFDYPPAVGERRKKRE
jgi:hypothetical protein